jgi:aarF domain-containing kinase
LEEEPNQNVFRRIWAFFNRWIFEPLGTTRRFLYLASIFLPVILTAPVLALEWVGTEVNTASGRKQKRKHERTTTRWWYWLLVKQMERAGPTFIKVRKVYSSPIIHR